LDDAVSAAKGAILEGSENTAQGVLNNVLQGSSLGGLSGVLDQLNGSGLGHLVSSWTGDSQNLPISLDQLKGALTQDHIQEIAGALHMDPNSALAHLAEHLPMLAGKPA
jgi:uncharacterized protein YidB (DUF937 family)